MDELKELEALAGPLVEYLHKKHHPHTAILITDERVTLMEDVMSVLLEQKDQPILL